MFDIGGPAGFGAWTIAILAVRPTHRRYNQSAWTLLSSLRGLCAIASGATLRRMEDCLNVVKQWITSNFLCMNDNKTDYFYVAPKMAAALVVDSVIHVNYATITVSRYVRNLGVIIDRNLDFKEQVSSIVCAFNCQVSVCAFNCQVSVCAFNCQVSVCAFHLSHINQMSRYLPPTTKERFANAIMTSLLDYCNSLLHGTTVNNIARLQRLHNSAARLILRSDSAMPLLCVLHWLPVARRIDFKQLVFTYKAVHGDKTK